LSLQTTHPVKSVECKADALSKPGVATDEPSLNNKQSINQNKADDSSVDKFCIANENNHDKKEIQK